MRLELLGAATLLFSLAVLLVALLRRPLRRVAGAQAQYGLWLLVPAVLIAALVAALQPQRPLRWQIELPEQAFSVAEPGYRASPLAKAPQPVAPTAATLLLGLWLLGAAGCATVWSLAHRRLMRQRRLPSGASAALVGAWKPRVQLPVDFRQRFPATERRLILLHERLHAERGDTRWLLLALGLVAAQWFNPLAWWALRRLRADMELACDAALLRRHPDRLKTYRQALLRAQGVSLPLSATPCSSHPLIERLSMLPTHSLKTPRRGLTALLVALAAGLAYAAQPAVPERRAPTPPDVNSAPAAPDLPTPAAAPIAARPSTLPTPPAPKAPHAKHEVPAPPAVSAPLPPAQPLLRTDVRLTVGGQQLEEAVLLEAFDKPSRLRFKTPNGEPLELELTGMPADESRFPKDSIQLNIGVTKLSTGELLFRPRLVTGNGVEARIERGQQRADGGPDPDFIRIDLLTRKLQSAEVDVEAARAALQRDIEAGRAPAPFKR